MKKIKNFIKKNKFLLNIILFCRYILFSTYYLLRFQALSPCTYFIFTNKKLSYIPISKVAQTTIINSSGVMNPKEYEGVKDKNLGYKTTHYSKLEGEYLFTFVRNPFERLYSCWKSKYITDFEKYNKLFHDFEYYLFGLLRKKTNFAIFVKKVSAIPDRFSDKHFISQYFLLNNLNSNEIDFIGNFENLEESFKPIQEKYNLNKILHMNKSQDFEDEWKKAYTPELVEMVYKRYKKDFEIWYPNAKKDLLNFIKNNS